MGAGVSQFVIISETRLLFPGKGVKNPYFPFRKHPHSEPQINQQVLARLLKIHKYYFFI
jgi:hypothetical protein